MLTRVTQGKPLFLGYRELLGRQQLMQDCRVGEAGLCKQAQLEEMTIHFDQLISTEGVRWHWHHCTNMGAEVGIAPKACQRACGTNIT